MLSGRRHRRVYFLRRVALDMDSFRAATSAALLLRARFCLYGDVGIPATFRHYLTTHDTNGWSIIPLKSRSKVSAVKWDPVRAAVFDVHLHARMRLRESRDVARQLVCHEVRLRQSIRAGQGERV